MEQDFLTLVKNRQSDRSYDANRPVEPEKLDYILEAARLAPSACNAQPWSFIVVNDPEIKKQTASAISSKALSMNHFAHQAPIHIVIVEEPTNFTATVGSIVKRKHFPHMDLGIAAAHITLAAAEQGLGTCIVGWFNERKIKKILRIPSFKRPVLIITLGYSTQRIGEKKRKTMKDILKYN